MVGRVIFLLASFASTNSNDLNADSFLEKVNEHFKFERQPGLLYEHNESLDGTRFVPANELKAYLPLAKYTRLNVGVPIIAFSGLHDSSIAISVDGRVQCVLELERLFGVRLRPDASAWRAALRVFRTQCECDTEARRFPTSFTFGILVNFHSLDIHSLQFKEFRELVEAEELNVDQWQFVDHQLAHALSGFYSSPFRSALFFSYDGGGNDGTFNIYFAVGTQVHRIFKENLNMGTSYSQISRILPEVSHEPLEELCVDPVAAHKKSCAWAFQDALPNGSMPGPRMPRVAGKLMEYSALGIVDDDYIPELCQIYIENYSSDPPIAEKAFAQLVLYACQGQENQRKVAAAFQGAWQKLAFDKIFQVLWASISGMRQPFEGVVLTGGCALNVVANQRIWDELQSIAFPTACHGCAPFDLYVPPAQSDEGLVVGALFAVLPPLVRQPLQYLGFRLFDEDTLEMEALARGAQRLSEMGGAEYLADLLVGNRACQKDNCVSEKPIIGIVRGRQEYGPRALGHRSLIAIPDSDQMRDRVNSLKAREWYRPVSPMISEEALEEVFGRKIKSPYMTMAPPIKEEIRARFPALAHFDGTSRHQSVRKADGLWLHELLQAVAKRIGLAALINTSFNYEGKPMINKVAVALDMFDGLADLDFLLIEDWLFSKS